MPVWVKKNRENGPDVHGERKEEKERGKKKIKILEMNRQTKLRTARITKDRETRENSGALRTVASIHANAKKVLIKRGAETRRRSKKKKTWTLLVQNGKKKRHLGEEPHRAGKRSS